MKSKKKEKEKATVKVEENVEADLEKFIQAFEKPTRIYRYLRTRHLVSPIFLQRNLTYMKHRRSVNNLKRRSFKVDSLQTNKKDIKNDKHSSNFSSVVKYLKLELTGVYNSQFSPDVHEAAIDITLNKVQHGRKGDSQQGFKQINVGKAKVPVNPNWNNSSLDGTQSDSENYSPCQETVICKDGFSFKPKDGFHSCILNLNVTCLLKPSLSNGVTNGDVSEHDEPQPKKRRSVLNGRSISVEEESVTYSAELTLYGKQYQGVLKSGMYDLVLQDSASKFSTRDSRWDSSVGKRSIDLLDEFGSSPTLKLYLCWTDDPEGNQQCKIPPCEFVKNNRITKYSNFSGYDSETSPQKIKEEAQSTPQKKMQVTYMFLYNDITRQQTDTRDNMRCPWCTVNCEKLYSLLKHLRLCHARFNILYVPMPKGARVDVTINDCYDGAYGGNPQDLNSHIGFAFHRLGPVRRTSITHVMVYRPKRQPHSLLEFCEPEKENQVSKQIIQGHNRLYYRTNTCLPLQPQEVNQDSEDEVTPNWLCQKSVNLIDEFTDVNEGEKELMKMWNLHCMKYAYIADCQMPQASQSFVEEHGCELIEKGIVKNYLIHLVNMFDFGLVTPDIVQRTMWQLYTVRDDLEMSGQITSAS
ncbi:polycomb protein suz12-B-like [Mercenaria mercenaria]|uniref:polycomb protein suz12-B-like n=1 Tax=Mercenaria mercenaria TaxID=6596 RepID=UPI00234E56A5|nr:polycomb protein suz12-B-like [Mercenaria mercenaria]